ncbi:hypothetical protein TWF706_002827 [Orbilia oligospora]|nr:hypothetical protein TWF706_002827 [Orbilia oligospora]
MESQPLKVGDSHMPCHYSDKPTVWMVHTYIHTYFGATDVLGWWLWWLIRGEEEEKKSKREREKRNIRMYIPTTRKRWCASNECCLKKEKIDFAMFSSFQ